MLQNIIAFLQVAIKKKLFFISRSQLQFLIRYTLVVNIEDTKNNRMTEENPKFYTLFYFYISILTSTFSVTYINSLE